MLLYYLLAIQVICIIANIVVVREINKEIRELEEKIEQERKLQQCYYLYAQLLSKLLNKRANVLHKSTN